MKKKYIISLTLLFMSILTLNAQNLWGVDASIDVANAEFQNAFTETGTASNYSINNWTALSISESSTAVTPGNAFWTRNTLGYSQGGYASNATPINSPSQVNGVAIFDSDFLDNNGIAGAFGSGSSPAAHQGELISPRIDLTGNTNVPLAVKFFSFYRNFKISELSVSFSSDDGVTWGNAIDYTALQADLTEGFINAVLPSNSTQGVSNLTQCRIKFTFSGQYYFAIIDDITIVVACTDPTIPTITASSSSICSGSSTTLNWAGASLNDATNWYIYTGSCGGSQIGTTAGNTFVVTPPVGSTTYYIRGEGGCVTPGSCASVTVTAIPIDDASFSYSASAYCVDDTDPTPTITGLGGGSFSSVAGLSISASTGAIDVSASAPGTYTVTYTTAGSCTNSSSVSVTITQVDVSTTLNNTTITSNAVGAIYQWLDCNDGNSDIEGETNNTYTATTNGSYAVRVTQNGCTDTSDCVEISTLRLTTNSFSNEIEIYPNPTNNSFEISFKNNQKELKINIYSSLGQLIKTRIFDNTDRILMNLNQPSGIYFVECINDKGNKSISKLIKK